MAPYNYRSSNQGLNSILSKIQPGIAFIVLIFGALIAFEIFNYSTTEHALSDLLGGLTFAGIPWATVLALAFCGIDFAGIARLFTPEQGADEPKEVWYLFGAWLLAATMNAILTWWGVSMAVANHTVQSSSVIDPQTIANIVPVFVAVMVWVIRILIIGTLSLAMDRLIHPGMEQRVPLQTAFSGTQNRQQQQHRPSVAQQPISPMSVPSGLNSNGIQSRQNMSRAASGQQRPAMRNMESTYEPDYDANQRPNSPARPDPTYHSLSMSARPSPSTGRNQNNTNNGNGNGSENNNGNGENNGSNRFTRR